MIEFSFTFYIYIDPRETFSEISLLREEIKHISDSNTCMFLKCCRGLIRSAKIRSFSQQDLIIKLCLPGGLINKNHSQFSVTFISVSVGNYICFLVLPDSYALFA